MKQQLILLQTSLKQSQEEKASSYSYKRSEVEKEKEKGNQEGKKTQKYAHHTVDPVTPSQ